MAGEIILSTAYGLRILPEHDPYIKLSEAGLVPIIKSANWGTYFVDFLPILKYFPSWLPGMGFKEEAKSWKTLSENMVEKPFEIVEGQLVRNFSLAYRDLKY
jgi:hypothetical protein